MLLSPHSAERFEAPSHHSDRSDSGGADGDAEATADLRNEPLPG